MKRILLIAATTGYQTRAFAAAGERLGFQIQLATDRCHVLTDPWGDQAIPLRFERPAAAAASIAKASRTLGPFDGIAAVGDRPAYLASLAAQRLGLPYHSPDSVAASCNKFIARERFATAGLNVPRYERVAIDRGAASASTGVRYPCVLKPLGLSASRGVIRANDPHEFAGAFDRIRSILRTRDIVRLHEDQDQFLQVEDYIEGQEFALEGLLTGGEFRMLALFDKPDPLEGPYFEETLYVTPSRAPTSVQTAILDTTRSAVAALGLTHGPIHAEMRVNDHGVWMLEVAARPIGGLCAQALKFESGLGLEEVILKHAAQENPGPLALKAAARGVLMIPIPMAGVYSGVQNLQAARDTPGVEDIVITAKEGQRLIPLPEGASYLGFIFAGARSPEDVEHVLRTAHAQLRFHVLDSLPVL